jgi:hypothetical protein
VRGVLADEEEHVRLGDAFENEDPLLVRMEMRLLVRMEMRLRGSPRACA